MQQMIPDRVQVILVFCALVSTILLEGCGMRNTMTFYSPSRKARIEVWQARVDNSWGAHIDLVSGNRRVVLFQQARETFIFFIHVYWSPDETIVGVYGGLPGPEKAVKVESGEPVPFTVIRRDLEKSIREKYRVPENVTDALKWVGPELIEQFFTMHPEIQLTYDPGPGRR